MDSMKKRAMVAGMVSNIKERVRMLDTHMRVGGAHEIARRYFVMNSFDGVLTMLGIIVGAYGTKTVSPEIIVSAGVGASIAMGVSGMTGAYMTERAERSHELRKIERAMLKKLGNSIFHDMSGTVSIVTALIDGLSPALAGGIIIIPFLLSMGNVLTISTAVFVSVVLCFLELFFLGIYLGKISRGNLLTHGARMVAIGILVSLIISLLHRLF
jgi:predicted membrane protein (TIGR00267 family)